MKIFNEIEIQKAALQNSKLHYIMAFSEELHKDAGLDFCKGVEYAESKIENICIEFVIFCDDNFEEGNTNFKQLFQQFLKERNEKF